MSSLHRSYKKDTDAFGRMLKDFQAGKHVYEIIEREDGYIATSDHVGNYFALFGDWPPMEQEAMRRLAPGRVLDLGCGAGRVELYLQEQGFEVVGIDISDLAVRVCQERGVKDARTLSITQVDINLGLFDNILMMGNNWGLMGSYKRAKWLLGRFHHMTSAHARIIAFSNDISVTTSETHLAYQASNRERGRMPGQIRMRVRYEVWRSNWFDYLMVSRADMETILAGTGWQVREYLDSAGSSYIAVIEKTK